MTTLPHLRALLERATPAPWLVREYPECLPLIKMPDDEMQDITRREDAELIVALRNLAPKLLAVVEAAEELLYYSFDADSSKERGPLLRALEALGSP